MAEPWTTVEWAVWPARPHDPAADGHGSALPMATDRPGDTGCALSDRHATQLGHAGVTRSDGERRSLWPPVGQVMMMQRPP